MTEVKESGLVWPHYAKSNIDKVAERNPTGQLGKEDFLKILVAQMRYQDPTQPVNDREYIAQLAQFSSVEQLANLANEMAVLRQSIGITPSLIGKSIMWVTPTIDGRDMVEHTGVVTAITFKNGEQYAIVGNREAALSQIVKIWDAHDPPVEEPEEEPPVEEPEEEPPVEEPGTDNGTDDGTVGESDPEAGTP